MIIPARESFKSIVNQFASSGRVVREDGSALNIADAMLMIVNGFGYSGIATNGTYNTLIDNTKDFEPDIFNSKILRVIIDGIEYYRTILACSNGVITISPILSPVSAKATLGSGEDIYGQVVIHCINDLVGVVGNDYSIEVVQGVGTTGINYAALDVDTKVLTITVDLNGLGEPRYLNAGDVVTVIGNTEGIKDIFTVDAEFTAGIISMTDEPIQFNGGIDSISIKAGNMYRIENPV